MNISYQKSNKLSSFSPKNNHDNNINNNINTDHSHIKINIENPPSSIKNSFISKINNIKLNKRIINKHESSDVCFLSNIKKLNKGFKRQKTVEEPVLSKKDKDSKNINNICLLYPLTPKNCNQESPKEDINFSYQTNKSGRRGASLLSQMNRNILNSSRNLINPSRFYKRYFNSLMNTNKKKDVDTPVTPMNRRRGNRGLTIKFNFNEKIREEKKRKSQKKSRKFLQILNDV